MAIDDSIVVNSPTDVTNEWLSDILQYDVKGHTAQPIVTGQVSDCYRIMLQYAAGTPSFAPQSLILKLASSDAKSRQSSKLLGLYERESRFYAEVASSIDDAIKTEPPLAQCHYTAYYPDDGTYCLLLQDAAPAAVGNEVEGTTHERAKLALQELGKLHAASFGNEEMGSMPWLNRKSDLDQARFQSMFSEFSQRYQERIKPEHLAVAKRLVDSFDLWMDLQEEEEGSILGLMHGDYRLDNLLFRGENADPKLIVVDWQTVQWGHVINDVAYFLGAALTPENREAWWKELVQGYYEALGPNPPLSMKQLEEGVREHTFYGIIMATVSPIFVQRTESGDDMFLTLFARHCQHALDRDALSLLPQPIVQRPPPTSE